MTEFVYKDYVPQNARVIIDYKARERVKFSYPKSMTYWKAVWKNAYPTVLGFWVAIHTSILFYTFIYIFIPFLLIRSIFSPFVVKGGQDLIFNFFTFLSDFLLPILGALFYLLGIPAIFLLWLATNKERLSAWIPKIGYWSAILSFRTNYKTFTEEDVHDNKVIIHSFSNTYIEYDPTGDFDEHLEKVEIMEIPFEYICRGLWNPFKKKVEKNDNSFRAVFYFSGPINTGKMEVTFI